MSKVWIVFERDRGFSAWLIRAVMGFEYNHCAILYESDDWESLWVAEATTRGVRAVPQKKRIWRQRFRVEDPKIWEAMRAEAIHFGEKYDYVGLVVFGLLILFWKMCKKKLRHPLRSFSGLFCSEYLAMVLKQLGCAVEDPQYADVRAIWNLCVQNPTQFVEEPITIT